MKRIATIVGARPQFIKLAAVSRQLAAFPCVSETIIHTGQHYDDNMSRIFFEELDLPVPEYNLAIGSGNQGQQTGRMIESIEQVLVKLRPDCVLTYGDTNSTLAGALAAAKLNIPVAHVEAGLRSYDRTMPEEINRVVTDHVSDLLFAPTEVAMVNLRKEGVPSERTHRTGDVMYDASLYYSSRAECQSRILHKLELPSREYVLATIHRASNVDDVARLASIIEGLERAASVLPVVWPVHPRTNAQLQTLGRHRSRGNLRLIDPVGYLDMVVLEKSARLIVTDSGGVQKEAFFFQVPCLTLREETEWTELVELGWNRLCPPHSPEIVLQGILSALDLVGTSSQPYGTGNAAVLISSILADALGYAHGA